MDISKVKKLIDLLLKKAASTDSVPEREACEAKVKDLRLKYNIPEQEHREFKHKFDTSGFDAFKQAVEKMARDMSDAQRRSQQHNRSQSNTQEEWGFGNTSDRFRTWGQRATNDGPIFDDAFWEKLRQQRDRAEERRNRQKERPGFEWEDICDCTTCRYKSGIPISKVEWAEIIGLMVAAQPDSIIELSFLCNLLSELMVVERRGMSEGVGKKSIIKGILDKYRINLKCQKREQQKGK